MLQCLRELRGLGLLFCGILFSIVLLVLFTIFQAFFNINLNPGTGEKTGQIVRVAKVGIVNQTWEAQLIRGGFNAGSGVMGQSFEFTFNENQEEMLKTLMESGTEVRIEYRTEFISSKFRSDSGGNFLTAIGQISRGTATTQ